MNKLKIIIRISFIIAIILSIIVLYIPGWQFSIGIIIGALVGIGDFVMIIKTMSMLKLATEDPKIMLKFFLLFMCKMLILLVVLGGIIYCFTLLKAKLTLFGFIGGLAVVPISIFISAFFKEVK